MIRLECRNGIGTIIIVHGAGEYSGRYNWLAEKWREHNYNVLVGDLPGNGRTSGKRGHIQSFQQYIDTVCHWYEEALSYYVPIFLLGHSAGGLTVIRTLMEKKLRVAGVILSSPCLQLKKPPSLWKRFGAKLFHRLVPSMRANSGIAIEVKTRNEALREDYENDPLINTKVSLRWYEELTQAMKKSFREISKFPNVPLLIMQAGEDLIVEKQAVITWFHLLPIEEKTYKEWPTLYHEIFNEVERERVFQYAKNFTNKLLLESADK